MAVPAPYREDLQTIVAKRHDNGADFWATEDGRWGKGSPFSSFDCGLLLSELGVPKSDPLMKGIAKVLFDSQTEDGRFRPAPKGSIYPCHVANALRVLCRLGYAKDKRVVRSFEQLLSTQHDDGGWRCARAKLGKSEATDASNPGVTLSVLDAFRFTTDRNRDERLDRAVETLLAHWQTRLPRGPCHFGIGTLFNQVEYPFLRYNLFFYVYVLSFYRIARESHAFTEALETLREKCQGGLIVIENPNRRLAKLSFCRPGEPSRLATKRLREILRNVEES